MSELPPKIPPMPLVGPGAEGREEKKPTPEGVRVMYQGKNVPVYYAFLSDPNAITLSAAETQTAKSRLSSVIAINPESVLLCEGKTLEEAQEILLSIESSQNQQAA